MLVDAAGFTGNKHNVLSAKLFDSRHVVASIGTARTQNQVSLMID
jgi:hypothetical protein